MAERRSPNSSHLADVYAPIQRGFGEWFDVLGGQYSIAGCFHLHANVGTELCDSPSLLELDHPIASLVCLPPLVVEKHELQKMLALSMTWHKWAASLRWSMQSIVCVLSPHGSPYRKAPSRRSRQRKAFVQCEAYLLMRTWTRHPATTGRLTSDGCSKCCNTSVWQREGMPLPDVNI